MDKLAAYNFLLVRHPLWEKQASVTSRLFPVGTTLGGGVLGGIGGAMSTDDPAERKKRALMGTVGGGIMGGLGGEVIRRGGIIELLNKDKSNMAQEISRLTDEATRADELLRSKVNVYAGDTEAERSRARGVIVDRLRNIFSQNRNSALAG